MMKNAILVLALAAAPAALAQKWEFGGGAGSGFYTSQDVASAKGSAKGKFETGLGLSVWLGNNTSDHWGGEIRYDFQKGNAQLTSGGLKDSFSAQTHSVHYDLLLHMAKRDAKVRPYVAFGAGFKMYQGTGSEVLTRSLDQIGLLTKTNDLKPLVSVGAGVKVKVSRNLAFRAEVHDFLSPFPDKIITSADGKTSGGWIHDIVATVGLSILY